MSRRSHAPRLAESDRAILAAHERVQWAGVRKAAESAFDRGETYRYHDGRMTHDCADIAALARATRAERRRDGVRWREDV